MKKISISDITGEVVAFDIETRDPTLKTLGSGWALPGNGGGYPVGYAISWGRGEDKKSAYLPVRHEAGGNLPEDYVRSVVGPLLADPRRKLIMANCMYDYGWAQADGYEWNAKIGDIQIQAPLYDNNRRSYSLSNLGKDFVGEDKAYDGLDKAAKEFGFRDVGANIWRLPAGTVEEYARQDAELTLDVWYELEKRMSGLNLDTVLKLEEDLVPIMYQMRKKGIRINTARAHENRDRIMAREAELAEYISTLTDLPIEPWAAASMVAALEAEGVSDFPLTEKKKEKSIDNDFLAAIRDNAPDSTAGKLAGALHELRKINKLRSAFLENMILEYTQSDGRIHSELRALKGDEGGAVSGRFAGAHPSLQLVPARPWETGHMVRSHFEPEEGEQWASIDYSSQEPRLAVHFGVKARCTGADQLAQMWREDPRMDAYATTASLCGVTRKQAKIIRLGVLYGMGGGKLCEGLGLPTIPSSFTRRGQTVNYLKAGPEGEALLDKFHTNSPMDKQLADMASGKATSAGEVRTILGRRALFPRQPNGEVWWTHKALNRVIQGSAADMTKKAMVDLYQQHGILPLVSVHDELGFSVKSKEEAELYAEVMSNAIPLEVPVVCDIEMGANWGDSMPKE